MSWRRRWVVLVPGEVAWVERRTREILEEDGHGSEHHFMVIPGQGRYQAIVERDREKIGPEFLIGRLLSLECEEPVYVVEGVEEYPCVSRFVKGKEFTEDRKPGELARSLGCVNEWTVEPPLEPLKLKKPTRTAAVIQGLSATRVLHALAKREGRPLPTGYYRVEETPLGLLLGEGSGSLGFALNDLAFRFPLATIYSVTATPGLEFFVVLVARNREFVEFVPPPDEATFYPAIHEVMGERTPERILAALGIPKEWFHL
jgi:hypothetical protein